uniref:PDZ domain-containing protein n=1 Tax=Pyrodinium bahamense TaxID=73915 RepID=A0A7S0FJ64_9DINO|mmetsp:Transcript_35271/g.97561  ORF Transcript_35271/g.97561 Transcript_35271/m.97561 type:complete len:133 (+) Transcript_35271:82-480(+)|eukprot:CAMPEP_0179085506 /NCGR_PEP_ID=MMETSP0796-20121207/38728_1 /TAXON_ID=73915 /ORGANISM="Pyrodinium bahamense, Strain pbaha01" /LENGTH=132 /DNA_ID=CAMNT_0020782945 /DNA_START=56 /DNA_END=454 /DNA_ORIENTATION=+
MGGQCCAEKNHKDGEVVEKRFDKTIGLPVRSGDHDLAEGAAESRWEFMVVIPRRNGMKLGIDTCASSDCPSFNVLKVKPDGLISAWNQEHPDREVREGDDLIEVNGVRGDKERICQLLAGAKKLQILIQRGS